MTVYESPYTPPKPPVHFVYKSKHGKWRDYFECPVDPNKGTHRQTTSWSLVTCPDCLKQGAPRLVPGPPDPSVG